MQPKPLQWPMFRPSCEFFELSKFLPKHLYHTTDEEPVVLTLENSVVKVKRATNFTEIEQWTTVLDTYMSVFYA